MSTLARAESRTRELVINIGQLPIRIIVENPKYQTLLVDRYGEFLNIGDEADITLELQLTGDQNLSPDDDVKVRVRNGRWIMERGDFSAEFNPETRSGWIRQAATPYAIDTVLRILHGLLLAREGGFLLHAASAIRNGKAFIFSGLSGAGKTTISGLAPRDATLLTDEISYIRGEDKRFIACGTPFAGELARLGVNETAPIEAVYLLAQGPENRIDAIDSAEALQRVLRNILFFAEDPGLVSAVFDSACRFVEQVPVRLLTFYPDERVWDMIH